MTGETTSERDWAYAQQPVNSRMTSAIHQRQPSFSVTPEPMSTPCPSPRQPQRSSPNSSPPEMAYPLPRPQTRRGNHSSPVLSSEPPMTRVQSRTVDRQASMADFSNLRGSDSQSALRSFNESYRKLVKTMVSDLAEIELRLGMRPLSAAQAQVRLEQLTLTIDEGGFGSDIDLAKALVDELYASVVRLESIRHTLRSCDNPPPLCDCQYLHGGGRIGPLYTTTDNVSGRTIQSFISTCAGATRDEKSKIRAVYDGLGLIFKGFLGSYDPTKPRCQTREGFLSAWKMMVHQPAYLAALDAELSRIQAEGFQSRDKGFHLGKVSLGKRLSNLFSSKNSQKGAGHSF